MKRSLILGAHGQDGRLLHELLAGKGNAVIALGRTDFDIANPNGARTLLREGIDDVYYLAAHQHSSQDSARPDPWELYKKSAEVHVEGLFHFLEAIRTQAPHTRLFYAASSLVFGEPHSGVQNESTPLNPTCIYGITKASGVSLCRHFRHAHQVFVSAGILFNHESSLRARKYVIPKIIHAAVAIARGAREKLSLGDLRARVDWGYAPDYVDAMHRILSLAEPDDFVVATGQTHSVQDVVETVFSLLDLDWRDHVMESPGILTRKRCILKGDASKLQLQTGWRPSVDFRTMLVRLVEAARTA